MYQVPPAAFFWITILKRAHTTKHKFFHKNYPNLLTIFTKGLFFKNKKQV